MTSAEAQMTEPRSPMLRTQASTTWATVEYAATTFDPASAEASATACTSAEREEAHSRVARENTRERLTRSATATATVV